MDSRDYQMTMGAQINNAVKLVVEGIVELETDDIGAEIAELAQVLYDAVIPQMKEAAKIAGDTPSPRRSSGGSSRRGSGSKRSGGKSGGQFKNLKGEASEPQIRKIRGLLNDRDHDEDIDWDEVSDLSKQEASDMIERLLNADPID